MPLRLVRANRAEKAAARSRADDITHLIPVLDQRRIRTAAAVAQAYAQCAVDSDVAVDAAFCELFGVYCFSYGVGPFYVVDVVDRETFCRRVDLDLLYDFYWLYGSSIEGIAEAFLRAHEDKAASGVQRGAVEFDYETRLGNVEQLVAAPEERAPS